MKKFTFVFTLIAFVLTQTIQGQVAINNDGSDANSDATLHVKDNSNNDVFYIDAATGAVAVHSLTPFAGDIFSSFATGTNWAINGYAVNGVAVYGEASGSGIGLFGLVDNSDGSGVRAINLNSSGWGLIAAGSGITPTTLNNHSAGIATTGNDGIFASGQSTTGTGVLASGNDVSSTYLLTDGSGGAFTGDETGVVAWGINSSSGTGVIGVGNGIGSPSVLTGGSGGAFTGDEIGVYGTATTTGWNGYGGYFENDGAYAYVGGWQGFPSYTARKILGNGSVSTIVKSVDNELITMTCPEAPEVLFQDFGIGRLSNGKAHISIDPNFSKNINVSESHPLKVFITLEGDCNGVYVTNKSALGFDVIELQNGRSNVSFSWQIVATRANDEIILKDGRIRVSDNSQRFQPAPDRMLLKSQKIKKQENKVLENISIKNQK
ncbi:MAG: hypothetical protein V2I62_10620 [Bacteroidales bacterium]|jgi:hypothetical protein|nr:hypothetical protein [Bacteroidales bacterium]